MLRLIEHEVVRPRYGHHDHEPVSVILRLASKLRPFSLQFSYRLGDVVAHQRDQMVPRRVVRFPLMDRVRRVYAHLARPTLEDQPTRTSSRHVLDVRPAEDVAKECACRPGIVGINQGVDTRDHRTDLLKWSEVYH